MGNYIILFLLFLLQFVFLPIGSSFFEGSKVYIAEVLIVILVLVHGLSKEGRGLQKYPKYFLYSLLGIVFVGLYGMIFDPTPTVLWGNIFRQQGTILLFLLLAFSLISSQFVLAKKYIPALALITLMIQFICALLFIGVGTDRPVGTIGEPNALAASVLFLWPFIYFAKNKTRKYWITVIASTLLVVSMIIITGSRSGAIAFGVQILFLFLLRIFPKRVGLATLLAVLCLFLSYIFPLLSHGDLYENRGEIWHSALIAGAAHPLFGVGFGNAEYALHTVNVQLDNHLPGYYVDSAHNIFLDWWVQGGIVGLGIFVYLLYKTCITFIKRKEILYIVLLLGLVAALSFNPASIVSLIALWWIIGQSISS